MDAVEVKLAYPPAEVVKVTLVCDQPLGREPPVKGSLKMVTAKDCAERKRHKMAR